jgi:ribonuclease E
MLETERFDRESDDDRAPRAADSTEISPDPAEAGQEADDADSGSSGAGGRSRGLFRRRRAATRPAGPPSDDVHSDPGQPADAQDRASGRDEGDAAAAPAVSAPGPVPWPPAPSVPPVPQLQQAPLQVPQTAFQPPVVVFQPPDISSGGDRRAAAGAESPEPESPADGRPATAERDEDGPAGGAAGRRRRRGGRGKGRGGEETAEHGAAETSAGGAEPAAAEHAKEGGLVAAADGADAADAADGETGGESGTQARRRRRRRRSGHAADSEAPAADDPPNTVVHVRPPRQASDDGPDVKGVKGSTRLEAKRQRRREGRESGRRRPPIITESEFLARREAVERIMVVRQHADRTQIAVLEDGILVEHYVDRSSHQSYVGNVYLGRVQNVLPSMEAAFVDIGKGRNAVLYAGEVNFDASGLEGESKRIESALKSGQSILVQVTKDPIGHKGARLTSQVSLPGRYLVYVPGASMTGISRKLPDTERTRLKQILKQVMPEDAGVIVRTAAEGATEEELAHDVARLSAQWEAIERKAKSATAPELLYSEPDLTIRVVRDIFNEDFTKLVVDSDSEWDIVDEYVRYVAPNLAERLERWAEDRDVFGVYRIDEQIAKALERKVWLPSGGSLVIDTTEAMTVIDVNTGKFTGQGGNLEQTVTRNNLEAAEEIVRQLRVRDVGGIIVIDFIDMVLESNRDLVLRRLLECLARDRTKHQVAEVTSLGLVQMTRKRVGSGLLEAFSVPCEHCNGRGVIVSIEPVDHAPAGERPASGNGKAATRGGGSRGGAARKRGSVGVLPSDIIPAGTEHDHAAHADAGADDSVAAAAAAGGDPAAGPAAAPASHPADAEPAAGSRQAPAGRRRRRQSQTQARGGGSRAPETLASSDAADGAGRTEARGTPDTDPGTGAHGVADTESGAHGTADALVAAGAQDGHAEPDAPASAPEPVPAAASGQEPLPATLQDSPDQVAAWRNGGRPEDGTGQEQEGEQQAHSAAGSGSGV